MIILLYYYVIKSLSGGDGSKFQTDALFLCHGVCKKLPLVLISLARSRVPHAPKHGVLVYLVPSNGANAD